MFHQINNVRAHETLRKFHLFRIKHHGADSWSADVWAYYSDHGIFDVDHIYVFVTRDYQSYLLIHLTFLCKLKRLSSLEKHEVLLGKMGTPLLCCHIAIHLHWHIVSRSVGPLRTLHVQRDHYISIGSFRIRKKYNCYIWLRFPTKKNSILM